MTEPQSIVPIDPPALPARASAMRAEGWRLMQVCCTTAGPDFELLYSFAKDSDLCGIRAIVPREGARVPSITGAYLCAFLYENEIHDLFGVKFDGLAIDFQGNFLKARMKNPFAARPLPDDPEQIPPGNCGPRPPAPAKETPTP